MPLRFQNVCRHRQTNNTAVFRRSSHRTRCFLTFLPRFFQTFPPFPKISCRPSSADPRTAHVVFLLSCPASFKLSRLSRKSPAGRFTPPRTARVVSSPFLPRFFQTFPPFPKISCRPFHAAPHRTRCFLTFLPRFSQVCLPFPKISCRPFHAAPHRTRCFLTFPAALLSSLPTFPENLLPVVFRRSSHRTRCFLTFLPRFFQTFPPFPKISCRPFHAAPHRTRCFLTFPAALLSNFPAFPENLLPAAFRRSSHCTRCFLTFLPRFFQTFPPFPKISCRPFHAAPHRTRCFLAFRSCSPLPCLTFSYHHFKSSPSPSPHNSFLNLSQHSK